MKNIFSKDIFKQSLKKLTLVSILTLIISVIVTIMLINSQSLSVHIFRYAYYDYSLYGSRGYTAAGVALILLAVMFFASTIFTYLLFSYQNKRSSSDKIHSLPYTRTQQFISRILAILVMLYSIIVLTMLTAYITLIASNSSFTFTYLILGCLGYMAGSALIVGVTATAMSFTGNIFANFTTTAVLLFLPRSILFIIGMLITKVSYQLVNLNELNVFLNPSTNIPLGVILDASRLWEYNGISEIIISSKSIIYTFIAGLLYIGIALLINNKRKSELAGKSFLDNKLSCVFAGLCVMPILLLSAYQFISNYLQSGTLAGSLGRLPMVLILFSLVLFIVVCAIYNARIKGLVKSSIMFVIAGTLSFVFVIAGYFIADSQLNKSISYDDVDYVTVNLSPEKGYVNTPAYSYGILMAKEVKIYDDEVIKQLTKSLDTAINTIKYEHYGNYHSSNIWCEFHLTNGHKIVRNIPIYSHAELTDITDLLLLNTNYYEALSAMPQYSTIDQCSIYYIREDNNDLAYDVFDSLVDEVKQTNNADRRLLPRYLQSKTLYNYNSSGQVGYVYIRGQLNNIVYISSYEIDNSIPETKMLFMKNVSEYNYEKYIEAMDIILSDNNENYYYNISVSLNSIDNENFDADVLHYNSSYNEDNMLNKEQLIKLCNDLKEADINNFDIFNCYAKVELQLFDNNDIANIHLTTFVPLSKVIYDYWTNIEVTN